MTNLHDRIGKYVLIDASSVTVDVHKSTGSWLVDTYGNKYLDCFSQFASMPIGWNHPKMHQLTPVKHKIANSDMLSHHYADFVDTFATITDDFKYHFYIDGGALAVENALKAAFDWKAQKLGLSDADSNTMDIIHLQEAFHGRSGYTLSLTNTGDLKTKWYPKFPWSRVHNPKIIFPLQDNLTEIEASEAKSLYQIEKALKGPVAAIIIEPIQGEGGDNHFRGEYLRALRYLANVYDALLIVDEVQTGVGLTGKMWCYQHFNFIPDIICFGKKMQVCGICATERLDEVPNNVFKVKSRINSTWGGNIVDMIRATMYLQIIKEDDLVQNAAVVGDYFLQELQKLPKPYTNARGRGLMLAVDLDTHDAREHIFNKLKKQMLAIRCGQKSIRFRPALTFSHEDVDTAVDILKQALITE